MLSRDDAYRIVLKRLSVDNLDKHVLAVEAVMRGLARRLGEDVELWGITGLVHDLDYPQTKDDPARHAYLTTEELEGQLPPEALRAIIVHAGHQNPETKLDWGLYCADPVTGLVIAGVLMHPSKDIQQYTVKSLKKRFKDKRFAAGANREQIASCEKLGLELAEFLELTLDAMKKVDV